MFPLSTPRPADVTDARHLACEAHCFTQVTVVTVARIAFYRGAHSRYELQGKRICHIPPPDCDTQSLLQILDLCTRIELGCMQRWMR